MLDNEVVLSTVVPDKPWNDKLSSLTNIFGKALDISKALTRKNKSICPKEFLGLGG